MSEKNPKRDFNALLDARNAKNRATALGRIFAAEDKASRARARALAESITEVSWADDPKRFFREPEDIGDGWWLCPHCSDGIESTEGVWTCTCGEDIGHCALKVNLGESGLLFFAPPTREKKAFDGLLQYFSYLRLEVDDKWCSWTDDGTRIFRHDGDGEGSIFETLDAWLPLIRESAPAQESLASLDKKTLWQRFPFDKTTDGYIECQTLVGALEDGSVPAAELDHLSQIVMESFTFLPGGNWVPKWMDHQDERVHGTPHAIVEAIIAAAPAPAIEIQAKFLRFVLCDEDMLHHDALGASADLGRELIDALGQAKLAELATVSGEILVDSFERAAQTMAGFEYGENLFPFALNLLALELEEKLDERVGKALSDWLYDADDDVFWLDDYGEILSDEELAEAISALRTRHKTKPNKSIHEFLAKLDAR